MSTSTDFRIDPAGGRPVYSWRCCGCGEEEAGLSAVDILTAGVRHRRRREHPVRFRAGVHGLPVHLLDNDCPEHPASPR